MRTETEGCRRGVRRIAAAAGAVAVAGVVLLTVSAGGSNRAYSVRAIFDEAANIIPGENVKIPDLAT